MYDAARNIQMKIGENRRDIIRDAGWQDAGEFLKWEAHYLRPESLNRGKGIHLYELVNPDWNNTFKEDLYLQYKRLLPMKGVITPSDKKNLTTADILLLAMVEESINEGRPKEELKKILYAKINAIPESVLTKSDKDSRKAQIRKLLSNIKEAPESIYDLSQKIQDALEAES